MMMRRILVNACHGGFGLSEKAEELYKSLASVTDPDWWYYNIERDDPTLLLVYDQLGEECNTDYSDLKVVEIPEHIKWHIAEYDGLEWVAEDHQTWYA